MFDLLINLQFHISITSCLGNTTLEKEYDQCVPIHGSCGRTPYSYLTSHPTWGNYTMVACSWDSCWQAHAFNIWERCMTWDIYWTSLRQYEYWRDITMATRQVEVVREDISSCSNLRVDTTDLHAWIPASDIFCLTSHTPPVILRTNMNR